MFKIRQLGYGLECGVIELLGPHNNPRNIAIFSNSGITGYVFISDNCVVLLSEKGEFARLDCLTGQIELRTKPFQHGSRIVKIIHDKANKNIIIIDRNSISIVDETNLTLKSKYNAGQKTESNNYTLFDFADVEDKFKALADKEREEINKIYEAAKAKGETPNYPPKKWSKMSRLGNWSVNSGSYCKLSLNPDYAVMKQDGQIVASSDSGLAKINLYDQKISFTRISEKPNIVRAISHDGHYMLASHQGLGLPDSDQDTTKHPKKKSFFGLITSKNVDSDDRFHIPLELWDISVEPKFVKLVSTGIFKYNEMRPPNGRGQWILPNDWYDETKRGKLNACVLEASRKQFPDIIHKLEWSEQDFSTSVLKQMQKHKLDMKDLQNHDRIKGKGIIFNAIIGNRLTFAHLINYMRINSPNFFEYWSARNLTETQEKILLCIRATLGYHLNHNLAVCFGANNDFVHTVLRSGYITDTDLRTGKTSTAKIEPLPKPDINHSWSNTSRSKTLSVLNNGLLRFKFPYACIDIQTSKDVLTDKSATLIYDRDQFVAEEKIAIKLARKIRFGYVPIRSKSVENLIKGLEKLTAEFEANHNDIIIGDRWDAGLIYKNTLVDEYEIIDMLIDANASHAVPVLEKFLEVVMKAQRAYTDPKSDWTLWHNDNQGHVGAPTITGIIRLSKSVSPQLLKFVRQRDFEHDVYMDDQALREKILPHLGIQTPGLLNLILIVALQLLATGRVENNIFASQGMDIIKHELESGTLSSDQVAVTMIEEVKALNGNLSWASKRGPDGLIAQAIYGLNRSDEWQDNLAVALLKLYPEAKVFLDQVA